MNVPKSFLKFEPRITRKPAPVVTRVCIPGRGRDFLYDEGTFENVEVSYQTWCKDSRDRDLVLSKLGGIARWLSGGRYRVLSDSYDPDYFRLAWCCEPIDPEVTARTHARQDLVFSCDPYRYSWAGNELTRYGTEAVFSNESWPSLPYIKVYGNGSVTLNVKNASPQGEESTWSAQLNVDGYIELDSFTKDTTKDGVNQNAGKTGEGYPVFETGLVTVSAVSSLSGVWMEIQPRWRTL